MFNVTKIQAKLNGLVGFRQPFDPAYAVVDAANLTSRSGQFVTDNPFCKIEFLKDGSDYKDMSDAEFNTFLKRKQEESIINVCNGVFNQSDYLDRNLLFKYAYNKANLITLPAGFVGYKIKVSTKKNIAFNITRVLCDFGVNGSFTLQLFNTAAKTALFSQAVTITTDHQEVLLDWKVDNSGDTYKGDYYIGYVTDSVLAQPYARDYELSNLESSYTYLSLTQILIPNHTASTLFDLELEESMSDAIGLNFDITVYEDFTDLIINNEMLFATAINYDLTISCLGTSLASIRSNRNERMGDVSATRLQVEIDGTTADSDIKVTGLISRLTRSISTIKNEIKKLQVGYFGRKLFTRTAS